MINAADIEDTLRALLPAALHACVPPLAAVIADLEAGQLTPAEAADRLQAEDFSDLRAQLAGQAITVDTLRLEIANSGDTITVGDISQAKGVAIGRDANAQVVEGDHNVVVGPGGIVINMTGPQAPNKPLFMAPDLPADFVPRPVEFERIVAHLLDSGAGPVAISAALRGAGGYGKTTLAAAVCHDKRIRVAFPDGVLWVTLGEKPTVADLVGRIDDLVEELIGERPGFISIGAATSALAAALGERTCLVVIDDVWNIVHLRPFLQGGPRCARLVTTRNTDTLPARVREVLVDAMQTDEALALIRIDLDGVDAHHSALRALASRLGEWPLLLRLVNGVLRERVRSGQALPDALDVVGTALGRRGLTAFDARNAVERSQAVATTLSVSLDMLRSDEQARYAELAIFAEDVDIPLATLARLWRGTCGLDDFDTEELCQLLARLSLLLAYDARAATVRLHDVVRSYLAHVHHNRLAAWHSTLLDVHRPASGAWADLPDDEPYLWMYLAQHLIGAGRGDELVATAQDLRYLARKLHLRLRDPLPLEADLRTAHAIAPEDEALRLLQHTNANICNLLSRSIRYDELAAILLSRVTNLAPLHRHGAALAHTLARPYLVPRRPPPDLPDPALVRTLDWETGPVSSCDFSPDGQLLALAAGDGIVRVLMVDTGALRWALAGHTGAVFACAFSPDGHMVASAGEDNTVQVWDMESGAVLRTLEGHTGRVYDIAFSPDGQVMASASGDRTVQLWAIDTGAALQTLVGHTGQVTACVFSPNGQVLASASDDRMVRVWDVHAATALRVLEGHTGPVFDCVFRRDGLVLASASLDATVRLWDVASGMQIGRLASHGRGAWSCAFNPDGQLLASASGDGTVRLWDVGSGAERAVLESHTGAVQGCAFSPDGQLLASASDDRTVRLWDVGMAVARHAVAAHTGGLTGCAFSPDGKILASAAQDFLVRRWDVDSGTLLRPFAGHAGPARHCMFRPDGQLLASVSIDRTVRLWDVESGTLRRTLEGHTGSVFGCAFSPDGQLLASASDDRTVRLWDLSPGAECAVLAEHADRVEQCAFSPDGQLLASASDDRTVRLWDITSGKLRRTLEGHTGSVFDCAFSPDGQVLVSAADDHTLRLWAVDSGTVQAVLEGHSGGVRGCAVTSDGTFVASVSDDGTVRLWDMRTGAGLALLAFDDMLDSCAFSPDMQQLAVTGEKGVYWLQVVRD